MVQGKLSIPRLYQYMIITTRNCWIQIKNKSSHIKAWLAKIRFIHIYYQDFLSSNKNLKIRSYNCSIISKYQICKLYIKEYVKKIWRVNWGCLGMFWVYHKLDANVLCWPQAEHAKSVSVTCLITNRYKQKSKFGMSVLRRWQVCFAKKKWRFIPHFFIIKYF